MMSKKDLTQLREQLRVLADALDNGAPVLSCDECQSHFPACVEAELEGEKLATRFPAVWHHLMVCDTCGALYADLLEVSMLEERDQLPVPATMPAPDLSFLPSPVETMRRWVEKIATTIVERMAPESLEELALLCEVFFERIEALGEVFQFRSTSELALAFGAESSPALPILAAAFSTTKSIMDRLETEEGLTRLPAAQRASLVERTAREEARRLGLRQAQANRFAAEYLQIAQKYLPWGSKDE
jgi:hypothetical protein